MSCLPLGLTHGHEHFHQQLFEPGRPLQFGGLGDRCQFPQIGNLHKAHLGRELVAAAEVPCPESWATRGQLSLELIRVAHRAPDYGADALTEPLLVKYRHR